MLDEFAHCPFCGSNSAEWCDAGGGDWHYIQCHNCEAMTGHHYKSKQEAMTVLSREQTRDLDLWALAVSEFRAGRCDVVVFSCFNEEDATLYGRAMKKLYPDVKVAFKWLTWSPTPAEKGGRA